MKAAVTKRGSILVFSLILFFMMLTIAVGIASVTLNEKKGATVTDNSTQALQIGDSAAELFITKAKTVSYVNELADAASPFSCANAGANAGKLIPKVPIPKATYTITLFNKNTLNKIDCSDAVTVANLIGKINITATYDGTVRATEVSSMNVLAVTPSTCSDGIQNGDELGVDCSGSCPLCACTVINATPWGACQASATQTRSITSTVPAVCDTSAFPTTQACTPPCTSHTYSAWGICQAGNTQTRSVLSSTPAACLGGVAPVTTQACTYCTSFNYSAWSACQPDNTQTRALLGGVPAGCSGNTPGPLTQACVYVAPLSCLPGYINIGGVCGTCDKFGCSAAPVCASFNYSAWGACQPSNTQTRTITGGNPAGCGGGNIALQPLTQACVYVPPACIWYNYSGWGACQPGNTRTRTISSRIPAGCVGGLVPDLSQACLYCAPGCFDQGGWCGQCDKFGCWAC